jgi:Tfp pilus assembly protein FimT
MPLRPATTLSEMLIALVIMGVLLALAVPPSAALLDRAGVDSASRELGAVFATARAEAVAGRHPVAVLIDTTRGEVRVESAGLVGQVRFLSALHGVSLSATRDSMSYDARGLGRVAANLTVIIRRGRVQDSLVVSRLGRVRD